MSMTIEQANGNWNFLYEFRIGNNWYPCNILNEPASTKDHLVIFTRNGTVSQEPIRKLRKKSESDYLKDREEAIKMCGDFAFHHGYRRDVNDDINFFYNADDLK